MTTPRESRPSSPPAPDPLDAVSSALGGDRARLAALARAEGLAPEEAVDCVQDALCTFLQIALRGELPADPAVHRAYLAAVVKNAARNERRRHRHARPHDDIDAVPEVAEATVESLVAEAEEHVRLRACVDRLCDTQRAVVTLRLLEDRGGEDVAAALGISRGHVDVLLHRAKGALRACLLEERP
jgi:RNA polymerase sigma-70 factor (ECF subfamily)